MSMSGSAAAGEERVAGGHRPTPLAALLSPPSRRLPARGGRPDGSHSRGPARAVGGVAGPRATRSARIVDGRPAPAPSGLTARRRRRRDHEGQGQGDRPYRAKEGHGGVVGCGGCRIGASRRGSVARRGRPGLFEPPGGPRGRGQVCQVTGRTGAWRRTGGVRRVTWTRGQRGKRLRLIDGGGPCVTWMIHWQATRAGSGRCVCQRNEVLS